MQAGQKSAYSERKGSRAVAADAAVVVTISNYLLAFLRPSFALPACCQNRFRRAMAVRFCKKRLVRLSIDGRCKHCSDDTTVDDDLRTMNIGGIVRRKE